MRRQPHGKQALAYIIIRLWIMHFIVSFHVYNNANSYLAHQQAQVATAAAL